MVVFIVKSSDEKFLFIKDKNDISLLELSSLDEAISFFKKKFDIKLSKKYFYKFKNDIYIVSLKKNSFELSFKGIFFYDKNNIPKIKKYYNKILEEYFFYYEDYTSKKVQNVSVTVDVVIFTIKDNSLKVLLAKRKKEPFKNSFSIPGGFIDIDKSLYDNAIEILKRDTNISKTYLEQLYTFGDTKRDPRGRVISVSYFALIDYSKLSLIPSEKYENLNWYSIEECEKLNFAFDHKKIIFYAFERIKNKIEYTNIAFQLLPEKFTLSELQKVYEIILGKKLDKRNFRKKIFEINLLEELKEYKKVGRMRPAKLYTFKNKKETIMKAKKIV